MRNLDMRWTAIWLCLAMGSLVLLPAASTLNFSAAAGPISAEAAMQAGVPADCSRPPNEAWLEKVRRMRWVAYSPPNRDTGQGAVLTTEAVRKDLLTLKKAGFTGLITYGSAGILGRQLVSVAESLDFRGVIMGIWNPTNRTELNHGLETADRPIVMGYSIGNEGLSERRERYSISDLCAAITELRAGTGKPATTSEDIGTYYSRPELLWAGDWIFAIAHPYWHNTKYPLEAIQWEQNQYRALAKRTDRFIFFKEVGLPSEGAHGLSEDNQDAYYRGLEETQVQFAYFEAFDQPSKAYNSVEPHWGIFRSDLTPKLLAWNLMGYQAFTAEGEASSRVMRCSTRGAGSCAEMAGQEALLVGKERGGREYRSLVSFDTSALPDGAVIRAIKLKIRLADRAGPDGLSRRQEISVDICQPPSRPAAGPVRECNHNAGRLSETPVGGWYVVEFEAEALGAINLRGETQFRLRMKQAGKAEAARNYLAFERGVLEGPILVVRYAVQ